MSMRIGWFEPQVFNSTLLPNERADGGDFTAVWILRRLGVMSGIAGGGGCKQPGCFKGGLTRGGVSESANTGEAGAGGSNGVSVPSWATTVGGSVTSKFSGNPWSTAA
jgi:hypothetical protein